jgi:lipoprotein-anchoring transpeptidase ErfK/SrfK
MIMRMKTPFAGAVIAVVLLTSHPALADPYAGRGGQSNLGGGFIEMLLTGKEPGARRTAPAAQPQAGYAYGSAPMEPAYAQPQARPYGAAPAYGALPVETYARPQAAPQTARLDPDFRQVEKGLDPKYLPQVVAYAGSHRAGTIVVDTTDKFLYLVEGDGRARRYGIGVGRPGFEWRGVKSITRKAEWPDWRPPEDMKKRRPDLPDFMAGGPENPMGARGLYLGSSMYRIHGTNEPHTIGQAVSSGCFRMRNEDVTDLYDRVRVGAKVLVM